MQLDYSNLEILIIDNGSSNVFIPDIKYRYRTRFYSQPVKGLSYARNLGLHFATGDIVAFIDDDAFAHSSWLRTAVSHFIDPSVACVTGRIVPVDPDGSPTKNVICTFPNVEERFFFDKENFNPLRASAGTGSNFMVRRDVLNKFRFSEMLGSGTPAGGAEEELLFFQVIQDGSTIVFEPNAVVYHEYPQEETPYRKRNLRNSVSRIAFLLLLMMNGGYARTPLLKHAAKRMSGSPTPHQAASGPGNFHWRSLYLGPLALMNSAFRAWKNKPDALKKSSLLREFPGEKPEHVVR